MIKHSHRKGQRLTLQRKTNNDKVKQNLVSSSLFIRGPGVYWPILWAATLPYFCSQRNVCMNLSARRNLICRRDKRNYAWRFKSWRGVQTSVSLRLTDVNIGLSRLDPISDLSSKPRKSPCWHRHLPAGRALAALPGCGGPSLCSLSRLPQWKRGSLLSNQQPRPSRWMPREVCSPLLSRMEEAEAKFHCCMSPSISTDL